MIAGPIAGDEGFGAVDVVVDGHNQVGIILSFPTQKTEQKQYKPPLIPPEKHQQHLDAL